MGIAQCARDQGLGTAILQAGLKEASKSSILEIVYLMVRIDNKPAVGLYQKVGFESISVLTRDTKIDNVYFDGLLMRKRVDCGDCTELTTLLDLSDH